LVENVRVKERHKGEARLKKTLDYIMSLWAEWIVTGKMEGWKM